MRELNLIKFYQFGKEMRELHWLKTGGDMGETWVMLGGTQRWLETFIKEAKELPIPKTLKAAGRLNREARHVTERLFADITAKNDAPLTREENERIRYLLDAFEDEFEHASRELAIFVVTPKGDKSTRILIEEAETKFPPNLLAVMPQKTIEDIQEAGRCLAFERATACAFHICRATEALMLAYYEKLAGQPWPHAKRDWGKYNEQLINLNAPERITTRLDEIRKMDRNAYAHPDLSVPLDEGPIVYDLCTGVIFLIAKEMV